jgi:hypothetical protein
LIFVDTAVQFYASDRDRNWSADGKYVVCDMGGALYRCPVSGSDIGKPEKIYGSQKMIVTNDHALSWDGTQIAATGITLPLPNNIRSAATGEHDFKHSLNGSMVYRKSF